MDMHSGSFEQHGSADFKLQPKQVSGGQPGGFLLRLVAITIDGIVCSLLLVPLQLALIAAAGGAEAFEASPLQGVYYLFNIILVFYYYGWFYSNKGATPGKLVLGLKVVDFETGAYLSYGRAFLRETIGKFVTSFSMVLIIGLFVLGRADKRMLHDFLAKSQVIKK